MAKKAKATVSGKPIPAHLKHAVPHRLTDQGIEEFNQAEKRSTTRVCVTDRLDRDIQAREAAAKGLIEPWSAPDPLQEAIDRVADKRPDMAYRGLSDLVCQRRGTRGWEPALDKDGREIKVGNLRLARMQKKAAKKRTDHYRELGNEALREAQASLQEQQEKIIHEGKAVGLSALHTRDVVTDSRDRTRTASVGLSLNRGNEPQVEE